MSGQPIQPPPPPPPIRRQPPVETATNERRERAEIRPQKR